MTSLRDTIGSIRRDRGRADRAGLSRRTLLVGAGVAGGLALAWAAWPRDYRPNLSVGEGEEALTAYLKLGNDGRITILVPQCEMGQGITTLLPQIMADELGADWRTIAVEMAPISPFYANTLAIDELGLPVTPRTGVPDMVQDVRQWVRREMAVRDSAMLTIGSTGVRMFELPCRAAAAQARAMLMMAAAKRWDTDWTGCDTSDGFVTWGKRKLRFGELAAEAATMEPPPEPLFRAASANPLYGQDLLRLDTPSKVDGSVNYAADIRLPGMVFAAIRQGPHGDTRLVSINRKAGLASPDVLHMVRHDRWLAVVARNWWAANRALDRFAPVFETSGTAPSTASIDAALKAAFTTGGARIVTRGDPDDAFAGGAAVRADYVAAPALHAPIETRSATAVMENGRLRLWVATQAPGACRAAVAAATGLSERDISLFQMQAGGSFGAALDHDVAVQAAIITRTIGRPVQLCWSRAEDIMRDAPRAPARARMAAMLDEAGGIHALSARIAAPAARHQIIARTLHGAKPHAAVAAAAGRFDAAAVAAAQTPYAIPHISVDHFPADTGLPAGSWRGEADSTSVFFTESFVDELAARASIDGLSYRMAMLGGAPRLARCLLTVTSMGGWDGGIAGSAQGLAVHSMHGAHIALMATARPSENGLQVSQLVAVADVGRIVNPTIVRQQIEGGLIFGLAAAVGATTDYRGGVASARTLGQLGLPRLAQSPAITIELIDSDAEPGGFEELAVPVVAPAIANAVYAASGRRIRRLPLAGGRT